jgi:NADP-dependent 3-hydroxy acid dehydrogenase YdfG
VVNLLAKNGYHVFAGVRRRENVTEWNHISERRQHQIHPVMLDVTNKNHIANAVTEIERYLREHGDLKFAGLVNNAGIGAHMPIEHHDMSDVRNMFDTNLLGPLYLTQKLLPLIRRNKGRIVFTSSLAGRITQPKEGVYSATKVGVEAVGDALRQELFPYECSVSLVEPGFVMTPILSKILRSEELGNSTVAGETYSRYYTKKYFEIFGFGIHHAGDVTRVARKVLAALTDARPKTRYAATNFMMVPTWLVIRAKQFIPDRLMDKILTQ